jgi:hypothetical protein
VHGPPKNSIELMEDSGTTAARGNPFNYLFRATLAVMASDIQQTPFVKELAANG